MPDETAHNRPLWRPMSMFGTTHSCWYKPVTMLIPFMALKLPFSSAVLLRNCSHNALFNNRVCRFTKYKYKTVFVSSCLRSWLEQDTSCPTCRTSLSDLQSGQRATHDDLPPVPAQQPVPNTRRHRARRTNRFHFDGNILSLSVECVTEDKMFSWLLTLANFSYELVVHLMVKSWRRKGLVMKVYMSIVVRNNMHFVLYRCCWKSQYSLEMSGSQGMWSWLESGHRVVYYCIVLRHFTFWLRPWLSHLA